jgi:tetratricopeptide (TPR) repeat protein
MPSLEDLPETEQIKALALYQFVQGNPDVAKKMRQIAREKNPNMPVPDTDVLEDKMQNELKALREELKKRDEQSVQQLQEQRRAEMHNRIKENGLDPEEVEKIMIDEKIGNYDTAIKYVKQMRELAPSTPEQITPMSLPSGKDLWSDKNRWAKNQAFEAMNELKAKRFGFR